MKLQEVTPSRFTGALLLAVAAIFWVSGHRRCRYFLNWYSLVATRGAIGLTNYLQVISFSYVDCSLVFCTYYHGLRLFATRFRLCLLGFRFQVPRR